MTGILSISNFPDPNENTMFHKSIRYLHDYSSGTFQSLVVGSAVHVSNCTFRTVCLLIVVETLTVPGNRPTRVYRAHVPRAHTLDLTTTTSFKRENPSQSLSSYNVHWPRKTRRQSTIDGTKPNVRGKEFCTWMTIDSICSAKTLGFVQRIWRGKRKIPKK